MTREECPDGGHVAGDEAVRRGVETGGTSALGLSGVVDVATREYRLAVRSRWVVGVAALFALFSTALVGVGLSAVGPTRVESVVASLAQLGTYLVPLAALALGFDAVVGADRRGSLELLLALPLSRTQVVVGKFAGRAVALVSALCLGLGVGGAALTVVAGVGSLALYARFVLAAVGTGLSFLSLGVLISALAGERTHALGGALLAWVWFVLLSDLAALGAVAAFALPERVLTLVVLANPADVFRVLVLRGLPAGGGLAGVLADTGLSTASLAGSLVVWTALPVALAARALGRRTV